MKTAMLEIPRDVTLSPTFEEQRAAIVPDIRRFDEVFRGIEYTLARWPDTGAVLLMANLGSGSQRIHVFATIEVQKVTLTGISLAD